MDREREHEWNQSNNQKMESKEKEKEKREDSKEDKLQPRNTVFQKDFQRTKIQNNKSQTMKSHHLSGLG